MEQRQFQPVEAEQDEPSQLPMQSDHEHDGRYASENVVNKAAAKGRAAEKDFMLKDI